MDTTTNTTVNKITIALSDGSPIRIVAADWPVIASANWHSGALECQANYFRWMKVRAHADGRKIVYGVYEAGPGGVPAGFRDARAGYFLVPMRNGDMDEAEVVRAIRRVAGVIGDYALGEACIANLPAREVT